MTRFWPSKTVAVGLLVLTAGSLSAEPPDTRLHVTAGVAAGLLGGSLVLAAGAGWPASADATLPGAMVGRAAAGALIGAAAAGLGKEIADLLGLGTPEGRDLANTVAGGVLAAAACAVMVGHGGADLGNRATIAVGLTTVAATMAATLIPPR